MTTFEKEVIKITSRLFTQTALVYEKFVMARNGFIITFLKRPETDFSDEIKPLLECFRAFL